jgi:hypothetical protein
MTPKRTIVGILVNDFAAQAMQVQGVLTEYGCLIKTRLGLHETSPDHCSPYGLVLLELVGDDAHMQRFFDALAQVNGIEVKRMVFGG